MHSVCIANWSKMADLLAQFERAEQARTRRGDHGDIVLEGSDGRFRDSLNPFDEHELQSPVAAIPAVCLVCFPRRSHEFL